MAARTPELRTLISRIGGYSLHATHDSREVTAPARAAFLRRFEIEVDPHNQLPEGERRRRAEAARRRYFSRLSLKAAQARARKAGAS
jgi:hypothetical protein